MNESVNSWLNGTGDKNENDDLAYQGCNLRFYRAESRRRKDRLSRSGRARKLATFAPRESYESFIVALFKSIKYHYNTR